MSTDKPIEASARTVARRGSAAGELAVPRLADMPAQLRGQVSALIAGPVRYPSAGEGDGGFVLPPPRPWHDPAAAGFLEAYAAACEPAEARAMMQWLTALAGAVGGPSRADVNARAAALAVIRRDWPRGIFTRATLGQAMREFTRYYPSAGELAAFLEPIARRLERIRAALDGVAAATEAPTWPARESSVPYVLPTPPPQRPGRPGGYRDDGGDPEAAGGRHSGVVHVSQAWVDAQLAAIGHPRNREG